MKGKDDCPTEDLMSAYYKHQEIMKTIPPEEQMKQWMDYELGCFKFFGLEILRGRDIFTMTNLKLGEHLNKKTLEVLLENKLYVFAMSHGDKHYEAWQGIFPLAKHIQLVNDERVNTLSKIFKTTKEPPTLGRFTIRKDSYKFDIGTMFNKVSFFDEVAKILTYLKVDDISLDDRVYEYYDKYMALYEPYMELA